MRAKPSAGTGLEGAPDIMLLTMAALMVVVIWLAAQAHETALPPIDLPTAEVTGLGASDSAAVHVTLRPGPEGATQVFVEDEPLAGGLAALAAVLADSNAGALTLRADAATPWEDGLAAMQSAAGAGLRVSVAVAR